MMDLRSLKRKYSWGPIPKWELDKIGLLEPHKGNETHEAHEVSEVPKRKRGRPAKQVIDGDSTTDRDPSA